MNILTRTAAATAERTPYDFTVKDIDGKSIDLGQYKGKVVLVVNVASQCGELSSIELSQRDCCTYLSTNSYLCCGFSNTYYRFYAFSNNCIWEDP